MALQSESSESENTDAPHGDIQLTLSWPEVERLRLTLPWLMRALADRPTVPARQRERRRKAHSALENLLSAVSSQVPPDVGDRATQ